MRHMATRRIEGTQGPGRPGPEPPPVARESTDREPEYAAANTRSQEEEEE